MSWVDENSPTLVFETQSHALKALDRLKKKYSSGGSVQIRSIGHLVESVTEFMELIGKDVPEPVFPFPVDKSRDPFLKRQTGIGITTSELLKLVFGEADRGFMITIRTTGRSVLRLSARSNDPQVLKDTAKEFNEYRKVTREITKEFSKAFTISDKFFRVTLLPEIMTGMIRFPAYPPAL